MKKHYLLTIGLGILTSPLAATLLVEESFEQTPVGNDLDTTSTNGIGLSGSWSNSGGDYIMQSGSLGYGSLATSGNSIITDSTTDSIAHNTISASLTGSPEVWFSFTFQTDSLSTNPKYLFALANDRIGSMFGSSINNSGTGFGIDLKSGTAGTYTGGTNGNVFVSGTDSADISVDTPIFIVGKIRWDVDVEGTATDILELYQPSSSDLSTEGAVVSTASGTFTNADLTTVSLGSRQNAGTIFDELRFGTTYADVAPVPEPSAFALLSGFLGLTWIMLRRRR
ncbi:hypothetical protein DDZ13_02695 [Coraliomargarita sinensis]|uniref:PEP-CTERM protein-sorting domain-containing protein n=1 Tax=Coraliomargarita sinensis TaxID=2174842 RepID=A0A317ZM46_9BACT|nr:PEP-CTERM sorting domain-containing protein [Coraliomargarita sinensis]PXA04889.1 hypothetical protein DDZ13_02695 [Coraliomargarita sinensis]